MTELDDFSFFRRDPNATWRVRFPLASELYDCTLPPTPAGRAIIVIAMPRPPWLVRLIVFVPGGNS
jgi:hypothetical protein